MKDQNQSGQVLILVNSPQCQQLNPSLNQQSQNQHILLQKNNSISTQSINKHYLMQLSCPVSQVTKASTTQHTVQQQKQYSHKTNNYQTHQSLSNLQTLKHLPRQINKNPNIKIQCKTQFPLVRSVAIQQFGWSLMSRENHHQLVDLIWTDTYVTQELVNRLRPYQKVNHFPHSTQMGRKDYLFANLNKMRQKHKEDYDFFAKTWIFPQDLQKFKQQTLTNIQTKFYIVKPVASCQGKGIYLAKREDILMYRSENKLLIQEYIQNTMLIDGLKFDVRIYVLITSLQPLKIYVYKQGLTRLATNEYQKPNEQNYRNGRMHLTNYAINKNNPCFVHNKDFRQDKIGHKRSLASLYEEIEKQGYNSEIVRQKIHKIIIKTVLAVYEKMTNNQRSNSLIKRSTTKEISQSLYSKNINNEPIIKDNELSLNTATSRSRKQQMISERVASRQKHSYKKYEYTHNSNNKNNQYNLSNNNNRNKCFQLLGFDIMIDDRMQAKLIQINHQPSLSSTSPLDHVIKRCLLIDVFNLLNIDSKQKQKYLLSKRDTDQQFSTFRNIQVKSNKKQIHHKNNIYDNNNNIYGNKSNNQQMSRLGGFSCIYPMNDRLMMQKYHKIVPILRLSQNPQLNSNKRRKQLIKNNNNQQNQNIQTKRISQNRQKRINKTSLCERRTQYACNYINMCSHNHNHNHKSYAINVKDIINSNNQNSPNTNNDDNDQQYLHINLNMKNNNNYMKNNNNQLGIIHKKNEFNPLMIVPRIKNKKKTQYQVTKKNLNFTIKYKPNKTKSISQQQQFQEIQSDNLNINNNQNNLTSHSQLSSNLLHHNHQQPATTITTSRVNIYAHNNNNRTISLTSKDNKMSSYQIQLTNDHFHNNSKPIIINHFHHNINNQQQSPFYSQRKQPLSLQKYSYPMLDNNSPHNQRKSSHNQRKSLHNERKSSHNERRSSHNERRSSHNERRSSNNERREQINRVQQSSSIRRNNEYFDKIYEKQLIIRITKMKSMKQKLKHFHQNTISHNHNSIDENINIKSKRQQQYQQFIDSNNSKLQHLIKSQHEQQYKMNQFKQQNKHKFLQQKKHKSLSTNKITTNTIQQPLYTNQQIPKQTIYQTIKLIQFQQPKINRLNHNHQKCNHIKDKFNTSTIDMFKDQAFNHNKKYKLYQFNK